MTEPKAVDNGTIRQFDTGATRDTSIDKFDYEGFFHPMVLERYAQYMHKHRRQSDGTLRDSDNWCKGMPLSTYIKSGWRHFMDWWKAHRGMPSRDGIEDAICGLVFNCFGYLLELLKAKKKVSNEESAPKSDLDKILEAADIAEAKRATDAAGWAQLHNLMDTFAPRLMTARTKDNKELLDMQAALNRKLRLEEDAKRAEQAKPKETKYALRLGENRIMIANMPDFLNKLEGLPVTDGQGNITGKVERAWLDGKRIVSRFSVNDGDEQEVTLYEIDIEQV